MTEAYAQGQTGRGPSFAVTASTMEQMPETQELVSVDEQDTQLIPMAINGEGPTVEEPEEALGQQQQPGGDVHYQMYVHAPEYHWHVHAEVQTGADVEGRAAIEELHQRTHDFARDTVREVEALQQAVSSADQRAGSIEAVVGEMSTRVGHVSELAT